MPRPRRPIVLHLDPDEIARRYRACRHGREKTHWQVLWLLTRPQAPASPEQVAARVGLTPGWVRVLLKRWDALGPDGLADRRAAKGRRPGLTPEQQAELAEALRGGPPDGGLWTGPKVAAFAHSRWGIDFGPQTGWKWLRRLGFTLQLPRPKDPTAATADEQRAWERGHGSLGRRAPPRPPRQAG